MTTKTEGKLVAAADRPFQGANANRYIEGKKMVSFVCPAKLHHGRTPENVEECVAAKHDPYFSTVKLTRTRQKTRMEMDEQTGEELEVVEGEETYYVKRRIPNWEQVAHDISIDSGQNVTRRLNQGWVFPEDIGYAPFCDYWNCSAQNPKYHTPVGNYHLRDEAALMMLAKGGREDSVEGVAIFIDDDTSRDRRRLQLDEMGARFDRG